MTIAVEAGLGFDAAMAEAGQNGKGPLAEELVRSLQDIQFGQSRRRPTRVWPVAPTCVNRIAIWRRSVIDSCRP